MPYNPETKLYTHGDKIDIPGQSIYDFVFEYKGSGKPQGDDLLWLIDSANGRTLTRKATLERTHNIARAFHSLGLGPDDALAIFSSNEIDYPTSIWAAFRLGACVTAANPAYNSEELKTQLEIVRKFHKVKVLLVHPDSLLEGIEAINKSKMPSTSIVLIRAPDSTTDPKAADVAKNYRTLDDVIAELQSQELPPKRSMTADEAKTKTAFLIFSSGTTGLPKAVQIPHFSLVANVLQCAAHWGKTRPFETYDAKAKKGDVIMGCLPFYHIYGLIVTIHLSIFNATPLVVLRKFSLPNFCQTVERYRITSLYVVPPMIVAMVKNDISKYDMSSVRMVMTGAAPLSEETAGALRKKFPKWVFGQGYGATETCTVVSLFDSSFEGGFPAASAGVLMPNIEGKIVSPEGKLLGPGEVGELWTKSPSNALGYLGNEKATKETFDDEGYVHTGDECRFDDRDCLYVVDRIKELIKVKGFQVAPAELEGHLLEHPDVQDVCVIGIPNDRDGERAKAYVHLSPSALDKVKDASQAQKVVDSIKKHVADHKIHYKHLGEVEFIDAIPKTPSGKLLRKDLRVLHASKTKGIGKL